MGRQGRAMSIARHRLRVCILVAILAFTLLGVESRRGGRLQKGSLWTSGSFVMAANRAGNDELEDEMTGFEDAGLSESLDESEVIPVLLSHELGESGSTQKSSIGYLFSLAEVQKQCPTSRLQCPS